MQHSKLFGFGCDNRCNSNEIISLNPVYSGLYFPESTVFDSVFKTHMLEWLRDAANGE